MESSNFHEIPLDLQDLPIKPSTDQSLSDRTWSESNGVKRKRGTVPDWGAQKKGDMGIMGEWRWRWVYHDLYIASRIYTIFPGMDDHK